jgi:hypothetical protein
LGFPTGWSFTTHRESSGVITHAPAANFLAPLPRIEEEEASSSTRHQHNFLAPLPGRRVEDLCKGSFSHTHPLLCFIVLLCFIYFTCIVLYQKTQKIESLVVVLLVYF